jgi:O-antigen/teichoic acid export membrane protein
VSRAVLGELYGFGFDSVTLMLAERIRKWSIPLVISQVLGPAQVVFFAQPAKLVDYGLALLNQVRQPLMPYLSSLGGTGSRPAWFALSRALQTPLFLLAVSVYFLGEPFIGRWIGPEYAVAGRDVIRLLALGMVAEGIAGASGSLLVAEARHGRPARLAVALSAVHVGAAVLLAGRYGLAGVAASLATVNVLTGAVMLVAASRLMGTTSLAFLRRTALRFLPATAAAVLVHLGLAAWHPPAGYPAILVAGALGAVVYLPLAWFLGFTPEDRRALRALGTR